MVFYVEFATLHWHLHTAANRETAKPEQQRFTIQSGVLTGISSRQCSAISGRPLSDIDCFILGTCTS